VLAGSDRVRGRDDPQSHVQPGTQRLSQRWLHHGQCLGLSTARLADYNNVLNSGVTVTPAVLGARRGRRLDGPTFIEDRKTLGLGLKFSYNKKYTLEMNYVDYANADFDPLQDRDFYSASVSVTF
jgi:hypothetical protein